MKTSFFVEMKVHLYSQSYYLPIYLLNLTIGEIR